MGERGDVMEWVEAIRTAISYVEAHLADDHLTTETVADVQLNFTVRNRRSLDHWAPGIFAFRKQSRPGANWSYYKRCSCFMEGCT